MAANGIRRFCAALTRRKPMDINDDMPTGLDRCLNTLDLTAMGVGATLGFGLYVLTGEVAATKAGPGVILSFMIAAVASTFSALCYAEFAAKVPKSGSAYAYSYITVGEFIAFIIGWNLMLEHVIGTAALARGYSGYLSTLFSNTAGGHLISSTNSSSSSSSVSSLLVETFSNGTATAESMPSALPLVMAGHVGGNAATGAQQSLFAQFDEVALLLTVLVTGLLLLGVQVSSRFQITFASINLSVAVFIFICGLFKADFHNWNLKPSELPADGSAGTGGFLPFGFTGVMAGAGTVFFAFVGFDGIAATAEEVRNPRKAIPNSIIWTSIIIFFTYCGIATVQTLIWPYYDQNKAAPLPYIFEQLNMPFAKWTILVGVLAGLSTSFVGGFLPLPRIMYAMARDGVIYRVLAMISERFKVPFVSTIVGGIIISLMASTLDISQLSDMLSIGTLAAYSLVSVSVLLLRYEYRKPKQHYSLPTTAAAAASASQTTSNLTRDDDNAKTTALQAIQNEAASQQHQAKQANIKLTVGDNLGAHNLMSGGQPAKVANSVSDAASTNSSIIRNIDDDADDDDDDDDADEYDNDVLQDDVTAFASNKDNANVRRSIQQQTTTNTKQQRQPNSESADALPTSHKQLQQCRPSATPSACSARRRDSYAAHIERPLWYVFWQGTTNVQRNADGSVVSKSLRIPDIQSTSISRVLIALLIVITTVMDFVLVKYNELATYLSSGEHLSLSSSEQILNYTIVTLFAVTILLSFLLNRLPTTIPCADSFEVPLVPGIPLFSIIINTYLMINLPGMTWIRFAVWMSIGFFIYFTYGIFHSTGYMDSRCD